MADVDRDWLGRWMDAVASGASTMSQRALTSIEARGGIDAAIREARRRGVHLVQLTDEQGRTLVAASREAFKTLC